METRFDFFFRTVILAFSTLCTFSQIATPFLPYFSINKNNSRAKKIGIQFFGEKLDSKRNQRGDKNGEKGTLRQRGRYPLSDKASFK